jgi:hypothetical protein
MIQVILNQVSLLGGRRNPPPLKSDFPVNSTNPTYWIHFSDPRSIAKCNGAF